MVIYLIDIDMVQQHGHHLLVDSLQENIIQVYHQIVEQVVIKIQNHMLIFGILNIGVIGEKLFINLISFRLLVEKLVLNLLNYLLHGLLLIKMFLPVYLVLQESANQKKMLSYFNLLIKLHLKQKPELMKLSEIDQHHPPTGKHLDYRKIDVD